MVLTRSTDDPSHRVQPEIRSVSSPFFVHPIQSGRVWVNPKPDPIQSVDSPNFYNMLEIQNILQKILQTANVVSDYW